MDSVEVEFGNATLRVKFDELVPLLVITEVLSSLLISLKSEEVPTSTTSSMDLFDTTVEKFERSIPSIDTTSLVLIETWDFYLTIITLYLQY